MALVPRSGRSALAGSPRTVGSPPGGHGSSAVAVINTVSSAIALASGSSQGLSALAKRIPAARKGKTEQETQKLSTQRTCLVKCVNFLTTNEHHAIKVWEAIENGIIHFDGGLDENVFFPEPPKNLRAVDTKWLGQWLIKSSDGALTSEIVAFQDKHDESWIAEVSCMFLRMSGNETLPEDCQQKEVLGCLLTIRLERVVGPESLDHWARRCCVSGQVFDWQVGGAYELVWDGDRLQKLVHRGTRLAVEIPDDMPIDRSYKLQFPSSDSKAVFFKSKLRRYPCLEFWEEDVAEGPHDFTFDKKGKVMAELAREAIASASSSAASAQVVQEGEDLSLTNHVQLKRESALEKAREALAQRPAKRAKTFVLDSVPAATTSGQ